MTLVDELIEALREEAKVGALKHLLEEWSADPCSLWEMIEGAFGSEQAAKMVICLVGDALTSGAIISLDYEVSEEAEPVKLKTDTEGMYDEYGIFVGKSVCLSVET